MTTSIQIVMPLAALHKGQDAHVSELFGSLDQRTNEFLRHALGSYPRVKICSQHSGWISQIGEGNGGHKKL